MSCLRGGFDSDRLNFPVDKRCRKILPPDYCWVDHWKDTFLSIFIRLTILTTPGHISVTWIWGTCRESWFWAVNAYINLNRRQWPVLLSNPPLPHSIVTIASTCGEQRRKLKISFGVYSLMSLKSLKWKRLTYSRSLLMQQGAPRSTNITFKEKTLHLHGNQVAALDRRADGWKSYPLVRLSHLDPPANGWWAGSIFLDRIVRGLYFWIVNFGHSIGQLWKQT